MTIFDRFKKLEQAVGEYDGMTYTYTDDPHEILDASERAGAIIDAARSLCLALDECEIVLASASRHHVENLMDAVERTATDEGLINALIIAPRAR